MSANTLKTRINNMYRDEMKKLKQDLAPIEWVCTTADIWSNRQRSFLGATVHWINPKTLERESRVLCCRRFKSPHDNQRIAEILINIHTEFLIDTKTIGVVTDNAR